jgi:putative N6-adenine-specific DNA methylase
MRETLAASFLSLCGYTGKEPVLDPLCGSGTFVIEAAEMALGLKPGRGRPFAFEQLATFEPDAWQRLKDSGPCKTTPFRFFGSDRDAGAVRMATANAARAGVAEITSFQRQAISALMPPPGSPGLVIANPPYGDRIGDRRQLYGLYGALGKVLIERFAGWRVGIITSDAALAHATALPFAGEPRSTLHGGLRVHLFRTEALPVLET